MNQLIEKLKSCVGSANVIHAADELLVYECDALPQHKACPRAVVFPDSTDEVARVVCVLTQARVPFAPRGAGTGLSGGALALNRGVVIELARMKRLLALDVENRFARVETGMVNANLSRLVAPYKLHYVPDPSSQATCTIGGNIAENAGGIHCLKYGVTSDHVLAARVVLSSGEIIELESDADDGSCCYDLLGTFIGSEGTFGICTEATLKLAPLPASVRTLLADFTDINKASRAVSAIIAKGFLPAALEMVDGSTIRAVEQSVFAAGLPVDAEAALLIELDGLEAGLDSEAEACARLCYDYGARHVRLAQNERERKKLWAARKGAFGAMGRLAPDLMLQDAVVPRSRLPEILNASYEIGKKYDLKVANVFHAGDGNLHPFICFDARDANQVRRVKEAGRELMEVCVAAGGTITGEHGVGIDKSEYISLILSEAEINLMLDVRAAFDETGLCNPDKIFPVPRTCGESRAANRKTEAKLKAASETQTNETDERGDTQFAIEAQKTLASSAIGVIEKSNDESSTANLLSKSPVHEPLLTDAANGNLKSFADTLRACESIVGEAHVSAFDADEKIFRVAPECETQASEILRLANLNRWRVMAAGGESYLKSNETYKRILCFDEATFGDASLTALDNQTAAQATAQPTIVLSSHRLAHIVEHTPADLTATAQAGVRLDDFARTLANHKQYLPLDAPDDGHATIGAMVAMNASGARSFADGRARNYVTGLRAILADGTKIKFGGRVVKNVAGYDMCKLLTGSRGTLAFITEATFKLRPQPARTVTVIVSAERPSSLVAYARKLLQTPLLPVALELVSSRAAKKVCSVGNEAKQDEAMLLVRFAGSEAGVAYQIATSRLMINSNEDVSGGERVDDDLYIWKNLAGLAFESAAGDWLTYKTQPSNLATWLEELHSAAEGESLTWHASAGDGRIRLLVNNEWNDARRENILRKLKRRESASLVRLNRRVKRAFDAKGIFLFLV